MAEAKKEKGEHGTKVEKLLSIHNKAELAGESKIKPDVQRQQRISIQGSV